MHLEMFKTLNGNYMWLFSHIRTTYLGLKHDLNGTDAEDEPATWLHKLYTCTLRPETWMHSCCSFFFTEGALLL